MGKNRHVELDTEKGINLHINRGSNYAANCKTGFRDNWYNAHHVIPCTSIQKSIRRFLDRKNEEAPEYNKALARFTHWDVNAGANLIGLPHKLAYELAYGTTLQIPIKPQWLTTGTALVDVSPKYPVHLPTSWGHTDYNLKVSIALDRIWNKLIVEIEAHEPVKGNDLGDEIQAISDQYRAKLMRKNKQTQADWLAQNHTQFRMD